MDFKKILISVDPSECSARAVSYVAEIVGGVPGFSVTVLLIERAPDRDLYKDEETWKKDCELEAHKGRGFMDTARKTLLDGGLAPEALDQRVILSCRSPENDGESGECSTGTGIAQDILEFQKAGGFGTLVVGRRGVSKAEEFLFGSVSKKVVHEARDCTVWVVE